jgi:hypothetical protein
VTEWNERLTNKGYLKGKRIEEEKLNSSSDSKK